MPSPRNTIQKQLVLGAVRKTRTHPTAEEIYRIIEKEHPTISKATVYRNLAQLAGQGEILRVTHLNAADRFDFNTEPHYHFRCLACGRVFDVELPYCSGMLAEVTNPDGFLYTGHEIVFTGFCPGCSQNHRPNGMETA